MNKSRRQLLSQLMSGQYKTQDLANGSYFMSFESCYPLLASARPFLADEVQRHDLSTEGKGELELVQELFAQQEKPGQ